jgi:hypothetical protein
MEYVCTASVRVLSLKGVSFDPIAETDFLNRRWGKINDSEENKTTKRSSRCCRNFWYPMIFQIRRSYPNAHLNLDFNAHLKVEFQRVQNMTSFEVELEKAVDHQTI